jgi:hypothetical protein
MECSLQNLLHPCMLAAVSVCPRTNRTEKRRTTTTRTFYSRVSMDSSSFVSGRLSRDWVSSAMRAMDFFSVFASWSSGNLQRRSGRSAQKLNTIRYKHMNTCNRPLDSCMLIVQPIQCGCRASWLQRMLRALKHRGTRSTVSARELVSCLLMLFTSHAACSLRLPVAQRYRQYWSSQSMILRILLKAPLTESATDSKMANNVFRNAQ